MFYLLLIFHQRRNLERIRSLLPFDKWHKANRTKGYLFVLVGPPGDHDQVLAAGRPDRDDQPPTWRELFEQLLCNSGAAAATIIPS